MMRPSLGVKEGLLVAAAVGLGFLAAAGGALGGQEAAAGPRAALPGQALRGPQAQLEPLKLAAVPEAARAGRSQDQSGRSDSAERTKARAKRLAALPPASRREFTIPMAPTVAGSQAERILGAIVTWLTDFVRENPEAPRLIVVAPVRADETGREVIVTFPNAQLVWEDGASVMLGDIVLAVTPRDRGFYDFVADLPRRYELKDAADKTTGVMTTDDPRISGTWWDGLEFFTVIDAAFHDIRVGTVDGGALRSRFSLASVSVNQQLTDEGDGRWGGWFEVGISDIWLSEAGMIGKLQFGLRWRGVDVGGWRRIIERYGLDSAAGAAELSPAEAAELTEALKTMRWGAVSGELSASDVDMSDSPDLVIRYESGAFSFDFDGSKELATLGLGLRTETVSVTGDGVPQELQELLPITAVFELTIERLPFSYLLPAFLPALPMMEAGGEVGRALAPTLIRGTAPLYEARTKFILNDLILDTSVFSLGATGSMTADPKAGRGGVGAFDVTVVDLDKLIDFLAADARRDSPWAGSLRACLVKLRELGERSSDAAGDGSIYRYHLVIPAEGSVTINGKPSEGPGPC